MKSPVVLVLPVTPGRRPFRIGESMNVEVLS